MYKTLQTLALYYDISKAPSFVLESPTIGLHASKVKIHITSFLKEPEKDYNIIDLLLLIIATTILETIITNNNNNNYY